MNWKKFFLIALVAGGFAFASTSRSEAGVSVGIGIGVPVGYPYYGYYPYGCYYPYGSYGYYPRRYGYRTVVYSGPRWYWRHGHRVYYSHPYRRR